MFEIFGIGIESQLFPFVGQMFSSFTTVKFHFFKKRTN